MIFSIARYKAKLDVNRVKQASHKGSFDVDLAPFKTSKTIDT